MTIDIKKIKFKECGYIINGKEFESKESARTEILKELTSSIITILTVYNQVVELKHNLVSSDVASVNLNVNVNEDLLREGWYVDRPIHIFFRDYLDSLCIKYESSEGGNYSANYMYLIPGDDKVDILSFDELYENLRKFEETSKKKVI